MMLNACRYLEWNQLTGQIPAELGSLSNLTDMCDDSLPFISVFSLPHAGPFVPAFHSYLRA